MEQFSLEEYQKNPSREVITRDGRSVRIICTDKRKDDYPILALCSTYTGYESCYSYLPNGKRYLGEDSYMDLFFAPKKYEGWVNVYKGNVYYCLGDTEIYSSESEAKKYIVEKCGYIDTCKIEWEE